jgi:hypothetical protein
MHNLICNKGTKAIAQALQSGQCPAGLSINLGLNNIGAKAIAQALQSYRITQEQLVQVLCQQLQESSSPVDPEIWQQLGTILPATSEHFVQRNAITVTISGLSYTSKDCLKEAARLWSMAAAVVPSSVQAQAVAANAAANGPMATAIASTPPLMSNEEVQAILLRLNNQSAV